MTHETSNIPTDKTFSIPVNETKKLPVGLYPPTKLAIHSRTKLSVWVRAVHREGGQTQTSLHKDLTRSDRNAVPNLAPVSGSNPGSSDLNCDSLTSELRPRSTY